MDDFQFKRLGEEPTGVEFRSSNALRWSVPEGTHLPRQQKLQQAWVGSDGSVVWKDVPIHVETRRNG